MIDPTSVILLTIYFAGGTIRGITRLQKVLFLLQEEADLCKFNFIPYRFGPYSYEVTNLVNSLLSRNILKKKYVTVFDFLQENPMEIIYLTNKGHAEVKKIIEKVDNITLLKMRFLVRKFSSIPLTYLIAYVYAKYPEYTTLSEIKKLVKEWRDVYGLRLQDLPR